MTWHCSELVLWRMPPSGIKMGLVSVNSIYENITGIESFREAATDEGMKTGGM